MAVGETISAEEFRKRFKQPQPAQKKSFGEKLGTLGRKLGSFFGGDVLGEALGTSGANSTKAAKDLQHAPAITHQGKEIVPAGNGEPVFKGPSGKAIAGDVLKSATTIASAALPGTGGLAEKAGLKGVQLAAAELGLKSAEGAAFGYASDVAQGLIDDEDNPTKPGVGTAIGAALPFASKLIGSLVKRGLAFSTGAGREVIDRAVHNPDAVGDAIRQYAKTDASKQGLVSRAKAAIYDFLGQRSAEFGENVGKTTFTKPFTKQEITSAFSDELAKFNGRVTSDGLKFESTTLTAADQRNLQTFYDQLRSWKNVTPRGIEDLRQAIGNHISEFRATGNTRADVVLGGLKKFVTKGLDERAPGYAEHLATYGKKTQLANDVLKELNLSGNAKTSTQINSILRLFKKDPEVVKNLVKIMGQDEADSLLNELSGAILSEWLPIGARRQVIEGLGTIGSAYGVLTGAIPAIPAAAAAASASPRVVGEAATKAGKAIQAGVGTGIRRAAATQAPRVGR
jgi:hypothetical protein